MKDRPDFLVLEPVEGLPVLSLRVINDTLTGGQHHGRRIN